MGEPWFGAKAYGVGLSPKTPAGWIATLVFVVVMVGAVPVGRLLHAPRWASFVVLALAPAAFLALAIWKSGGTVWRWRWGGR
jgi:hypothetical protein